MRKRKKNYNESSEIYLSFNLKEKPWIKTHLIYCHQSLSKIYLFNKNIDSSYHHIEKVIELEGLKDKNRAVTTHEILGDIYLFQKKNQEANQEYKKANQVAIEVYNSFKKHETIARTYSKIGYSYLKNKDFHSALLNYQSALIALSLDFKNQDHESNPPLKTMLSQALALKVIKGKGLVFLKRFEQNENIKDLKLASQNYEFATNIIQEMRNGFVAVGSKNELAEQSLEVYEEAIKTSCLLFKKTKDKKHLETAIRYAEQKQSPVCLKNCSRKIMLKSLEGFLILS